MRRELMGGEGREMQGEEDGEECKMNGMKPVWNEAWRGKENDAGEGWSVNGMMMKSMMIGMSKTLDEEEE